MHNKVANSTEQKYVFEFQDEQNVAVQLPTGVVSHSKSDHLGRKVFDELQLGKGLMNRTFTYHKGEVTQAHLDNGKVVSNPETTLVKQIEFADGRTIQYEYDAEEHITKVVKVFLKNPKGAIELSMAPDGFYRV